MKSGINVYLSTAYLAPLHYYARMLSADKVFIEQHENYLKQSYRNRCQILSANGVISLSIPVDKGILLKCFIRDVRISTHTNWQILHWRSLKAAYNSSPFFEYYADELENFFERKWEFLFDFNTELQQKILSLIDTDVNISFTNEYKVDYTSSGLDMRGEIHPKKLSETVDNKFVNVPYYQVFDSKFGFVPNMSILDLLFNMGTESLDVLEKMIR